MILLRLALDLDLATRIDQGHDAPADLARVCKSDPRALSICLDSLCAIGLLRKVGGRYRNSPAAARFLSEKSPQCVKPKLRHSLDSTFDWTDLETIIKRGKPAQSHSSLETPTKTDAFIRAMDFNAREKAPAVVEACALKNPKSLLDLGGGPGTFGLEFTARHPGLRAAVLDLPKALRVTRKIFKEKGYARPPLRLIAGDFMTSSYGGPYDAILASNILHMLSESECKVVMGKAFKALNPGGALIIHEFLLDPSKTSPMEAALFSVHMLVHTHGGRAYSGEEFRDLLRSVGCANIRILRDVTPSSGVVIGRKPASGGGTRKGHKRPRK